MYYRGGTALRVWVMKDQTAESASKSLHFHDEHRCSTSSHTSSHRSVVLGGYEEGSSGWGWQEGGLTIVLTYWGWDLKNKKNLVGERVSSKEGWACEKVLRLQRLVHFQGNVADRQTVSRWLWWTGWERLQQSYRRQRLSACLPSFGIFAFKCLFSSLASFFFFKHLCDAQSAQLCLTLLNFQACSLPGSSVVGILQGI